MTVKNIFNIIFLATLAIISSNCADKMTKEGDWDDCIKLSTKSVEFNSFKDSVFIKTGGTGWWVTDVSVNEQYFYNFENINLTANYFFIKQDCFTVERRDKNTLFIKVEENPLSTKRIITVGLEAGDYFDRVTITQKSK